MFSILTGWGWPARGSVQPNLTIRTIVAIERSLAIALDSIFSE